MQNARHVHYGHFMSTNLVLVTWATVIILWLFEVLLNFASTTSETERDIYQQTWYLLLASSFTKKFKV